MALKVKGVAVYHPGDVAAVPPGVPHVREQIPGPDMTNHAIEDRDWRGRELKGNRGALCVSVMPGDERIGDIRVNLQFEGRPGEHETCMRGHNALLAETSSMLEELFKELGGDWDVTLASQPCPAATIAVQLQEAAVVLERRAEQQQTHEHVQHHHLRAEHRVEGGHDGGRKRG